VADPIVLPQILIRIDELESQRAEALQAVEEADPKEAAELYRSLAFPLAAERIRRMATPDLADLLFVPVGTQAYTPILAALATPSLNLVLLATDVSRPFAEVAREALAPERSSIAIVSLGDGSDSVQMSRSLLREAALAQSPPPLKVTVDISGGLKAMAATLGAVAAIKGWRQTYVQGHSLKRHPTLFGNEVVHEMAHFRTVTGEHSRERALWHLASGDFVQAGWALVECQSRGLATDLDDALLYACEGLSYWKIGRHSEAAAALSSCAALCGEGKAGARVRDWVESCTQGLSPRLEEGSPLAPWEVGDGLDEDPLPPTPAGWGGLAYAFVDLLRLERTL
jgi:hypothetical protein